MLVTTDRERQRVIVTGERFQVELTWSRAGLREGSMKKPTRTVAPGMAIGARADAEAGRLADRGGAAR